MASSSNTRKENKPGSLYVDETCINCGTCRLFANRFFQEVNGKSAVAQQPLTGEEWVLANQAIISCPTNSIGSKEKRSEEMQRALKSLPLLIEDNVFYCGYASPSSFGASSYLIVRESGNVLVDSPRFNSHLAKRIETLGGIKYLFLTHRDDVADHVQFQKHFNCERIIHIDDVTSETKNVEVKIQETDQHVIADDLIAISTPGHTKGHMVLLYKNKFLFTGDHLAYSRDEQKLYAFDDACWYSWPQQIRSVDLLRKYSFEWVLPGHGEMGRVEDTVKMIDSCVKEMKSLQ